MNTPIPDAKERALALDPGRSFIIQAPAGSGKTELLTQRILTLLAQVEEPEEILAITFTRKAAGEMRNRLLNALQDAHKEQPDGKEAHTLLTWNLAREARAQDKKQSWGLMENPGRLRIQTIDGFCSSIVRQLPWLARFGGSPVPTEDPSIHYREATIRTLAALDSGDSQSGSQGDSPQGSGPLSDALYQLLTHLGNNQSRVIGLLESMLARRDQWQRHITDKENFRHSLEEALKHTVESILKKAASGFPPSAVSSLIPCGKIAAKNLIAEGSTSPIIALENWQGLPSADFTELSQWKGMAALLLTGVGALRKNVNKNQGFPADSPDKIEMKALIETLNDHGGEWLEFLALVPSLPPAQYPEDQWVIMEALMELLPASVTFLETVFKEESEVDFSMIALRALKALENLKHPLPEAVSHLLIDEFQDTSVNQYLLVERIIRGWKNDKTLFLVGDPMQSIYRFREAEVGLFLRAWNGRLGDVTLTPLRLVVNFRSQSHIVQWINQAFQQILPPAHNAAEGAVSYSQAESIHPGLSGEAVSVHAGIYQEKRDHEKEAKQVVELIQQALAENSDCRIAILFRARSHLSAILPALKQANLPFQAVDVDPLAGRRVLLDLQAITAALNHPGSRVPWLALLRAPWCGLRLNEMLSLSGGHSSHIIWESLEKLDAPPEGFSAERWKRVLHLRDVMGRAMKQVGRVSLAQLIEGVWMELSGAVGLDESEKADAQRYFELVEQFQEGGIIPDEAAFQEKLDSLYATPGKNSGLQVMSIHKAKGLEFDTVILPGLDRPSGREAASLLIWDERPAEAQGQELLLSPISPTGNDANLGNIYKFIQEGLKRKTRHEMARVLYVAITRAKKRVHLIGQVKNNDKELKPGKSSLLAHLWPVVGGFFEREEEETPSLATSPDHPYEWMELPDGYAPPPFAINLSAVENLPPAQNPPVAKEEMPVSAPLFSRVNAEARHVGTMVHRILVQIAEDGIDNWGDGKIAARKPWFQQSLRRMGVAEANLPQAVTKVEQALIKALKDDKGRWILSPHQKAENEKSITSTLEGKLYHLQVDRTFCEEENIRWIVDYKTSQPRQDESEEVFLEREKATYQIQLDRYGAAWRQLEPDRKIKLGLYFPLAEAWKAWDLA